MIMRDQFHCDSLVTCEESEPMLQKVESCPYLGCRSDWRFAPIAAAEKDAALHRAPRDFDRLRITGLFHPPYSPDLALCNSGYFER
jgi:hypothetical protein